MPIRLRLAGLFALGTAVAVVVVGVLFVHFLAAGLGASLDSSLRTRADAIAQSLGSSPTPDAAAGPAATLRGQGEALAQILGPSGQLVAYSPGAGDTTLIGPAVLARARHGVVVYSTVVGGGERQGANTGDSRAGEHQRIFVAPLARSGGASVIVVASSLETTDAAVHRVTRAAAFAGLPAVVAASVAAWLLASAALRPVERMRRQVADIGAHDPHAGIEVPATRDEIAALAQTMNDLLVRLSEALRRERGFVADAGHELRTPLAILRTELELASRPGRSHAELVNAVAAAAEETDRLARLAEDLLLLARSDNTAALQRQATDVHSLLSAAAGRVEGAARARRISVAIDAPSDLEAEVDAARVRQAVDNLLDNALRHAPEGTTVSVRAHREAGNLIIEVSDEGPGFPPSFLPHAFKRFRRADPARASQDGGAGLGLAIVASIAQAHGGRAVAGNGPNGGAFVRLELPVATLQSSPDPLTEPAAAVRPQRQPQRNGRGAGHPRLARRRDRRQ